jgi:hypothetical protein
MNNRILEIAHQVLPREDHLIETDVKEYAYFFASHELVRFAQLIVEECADRLTQDDFSSMRGVMRIAGAKLKEHFGVEV